MFITILKKKILCLKNSIISLRDNIAIYIFFNYMRLIPLFTLIFRLYLGIIQFTIMLYSNTSNIVKFAIGSKEYLTIQNKLDYCITVSDGFDGIALLESRSGKSRSALLNDLLDLEQLLDKQTPQELEAYTFSVLENYQSKSIFTIWAEWFLSWPWGTISIIVIIGGVFWYFILKGPPTDPFDPLSGDKPSVSPGDKPSVSPGDKPSVSPGDKPSVSPGDKPSVSPGDKPSVSPGDKPSVSPGDKPSVSPGDKPSVSPGDKPSVSPGDKPSVSPGDKPSVSPGDKVINENILIEEESSSSSDHMRIISSESADQEKSVVSDSKDIPVVYPKDVVCQEDVTTTSKLGINKIQDYTRWGESAYHAYLDHNGDKWIPKGVSLEQVREMFIIHSKRIFWALEKNDQSEIVDLFHEIKLKLSFTYGFGTTNPYYLTDRRLISLPHPTIPNKGYMRLESAVEEQRRLIQEGLDSIGGSSTNTQAVGKPVESQINTQVVGKPVESQINTQVVGKPVESQSQINTQEALTESSDSNDAFTAPPGEIPDDLSVDEARALLESITWS